MSVGRWHTALRFREELRNVRCIAGYTALSSTSGPFDYHDALRNDPPAFKPCQGEIGSVSCGAYHCSTQIFPIEAQGATPETVALLHLTAGSGAL